MEKTIGSKSIEQVLSENLSIVITTYNRSAKFKSTLEVFAVSPFRLCEIKILNNHSSDDTLDVANSYSSKFQNYEVITHKYNIGGDANIIRSFEYATKPYLWIVHDDDHYDFSCVEDIAMKLSDANIDLIHIAGHGDNGREAFAGREDCIQKIVSEGYKYFKYASFTPCNIIRVSSFLPYLIDGYRNIPNFYTLMPFLQHLYLNNEMMYISKSRVVIATTASENYDALALVKAVYYTSRLVKNKRIREQIFFSHLDAKKFRAPYSLLIRSYKKEYREQFAYYFKALTSRNKFVFIVSFFPVAGYGLVKRLARKIGLVKGV